MWDRHTGEYRREWKYEECKEVQEEQKVQGCVTNTCRKTIVGGKALKGSKSL